MMKKQSNPVRDPAFLRAALEGLELQKQRIEEQIRYVRSILEKRPGKGGEVAAPVPATPAKRRLSAKARRRIAMAQKKRWSDYRKAKAASAKTGA